MPVHNQTCVLCEASCGLTVTTEEDLVTDIRGDEHDPLSRGYLCPKGTALADLHHDPDRIRRPMIRRGEHWRETDWDTALNVAASGLRAARKNHGKDALGVYQGNPSVHNLGLLIYGQMFLRSLGTRNLYSATSVDQLPHMLAGLLMFGHQLLFPIPDVDRTDLFVCLGGNPEVSNGSLMTAPNMRARLKAIRARGGKVVVVDPRRTETAQRADEHHFIRPGTDALLLLSIVHTLFAEDLVRPGRLADHLTGTAELRTAALDFPPEVTAASTGIAAPVTRELARQLAHTPRAVLYGRIGICTQEFGGLAAWLVNVVNVLTGHLDEPGGAMFTTPALDAIPLTKRIGHAGSFASWHTRVSGYPEFGGESPVAALAEEIDTPGTGQVRALLTSAGNPVLSSPNGPRLEKALAGLDFMVSIDGYLNETTRFAHVLLPPVSPLERSYFNAALSHTNVRNTAKYHAPVFQPGPDQRHDWQILLGLMLRLRGPRSAAFRRALGGAMERFASPERMVDLGLRTGPYRLSLREVRDQPHGIDLGPLQPRLPDRLATADRRVHLAPAEYLADLARLRARMATPQTPDLVLIGRRQLRSANSWLHNSPRLVKGKPRCTLLINPADAPGLADGDLVELSSTVGTVSVPVEITETIMPGVVSLPHGWGHGRAGTRLRVAATQPGVSINDLVEETRVDGLSGTSALSGARVRLKAPVRS
ncbi:anaerobic selenocysteine-containing dehydrogenase [Tamaricihabitans halophyticus]|uniref:Anaerobic selenocysteine-containing dehydrogenase n=1 Tax=Tamaricihabitans halophyticus TaxID=1262583 RepID=A0A4R2R5D9_9PSEU|nr:molybdopterin-dependent oxidoreductase [Tamaricihabitans halophyticus]TCP57194.1 anaerobic selenocysteine-containing dehydrogenase [Tamaricihabitans halophyticus]